MEKFFNRLNVFNNSTFLYFIKVLGTLQYWSIS